ncbi:MAG: hypothetical protein C0467_12280 [Planctomycetaceae bacterium]|nr:hypothetical protein [Planctomycetaceae bacterium]
MNEDEAFIRAIVDNPGEDTVRLVYADWLDDHDDPRGPYLRAEHEWAATHDPSERETLRQMAKSLDPVWVARVSRPPVGVCCDHVRFTGLRHSVDATVLIEVEDRLKLTLPCELRAMLINHNGGKPKPSSYWPSRLRRRAEYPDYIERFYSVSKRQHEDLEHATTVLNNGFVSKATDPVAHQRWTTGVRDFVPFASSASGLGVLAIGLTGRKQSKVYAINRTVLIASSPPRLLAESLPEFLATLTEQQTQ